MRLRRCRDSRKRTDAVSIWATNTEPSAVARDLGVSLAKVIKPFTLGALSIPRYRAGFGNGSANHYAKTRSTNYTKPDEYNFLSFKALVCRRFSRIASAGLKKRRTGTLPYWVKCSAIARAREGIVN